MLGQTFGPAHKPSKHARNVEETIPNLWVETNGTIHKNEVRRLIQELDQLPFYDRAVYKSYDLYTRPDRELLYQQVVMTGRGCPKCCAFCFNKNYNALYRGEGAPIRRRSVRHVIRELQTLRASDAVSFLTIDDDSFTLAPKSWLEEFCTTYGRGIGIPFKVNSTPAALKEETVRLLKQAGCFAVKIGLESGNDDIRNRLLNKNVSEKCLLNAAATLKKYDAVWIDSGGRATDTQPMRK